MVNPIDILSNEDLDRYNRKYSWVSGTRDARGRVLGNPKRVMEIPERRVTLAHEALSLRGKTVTEFGCLEGGHTVALCALASKVVAIDARKENVDKTALRCKLYGVSAEVRQVDVEKETPAASDVFFHSGVLYHLEDPVSHLMRISAVAKELFLDTHHAKATSESYKAAVNGQVYGFKRAQEISHPRSGMGSFARWIPLDTILNTLGWAYKDVKVLRNEKEPAGPRVSIACREHKSLR